MMLLAPLRQHVFWTVQTQPFASSHDMWRQSDMSRLTTDSLGAEARCMSPQSK